MGMGGVSRRFSASTSASSTSWCAVAPSTTWIATAPLSIAAMPSATVSPVDDGWDIPGGPGRPERGLRRRIAGGGNHFIERAALDADRHTVCASSHRQPRLRHGLATNYFELARADRPDVRHRSRLLHGAARSTTKLPQRRRCWRQLRHPQPLGHLRGHRRGQKVFRRPLELVYEISQPTWCSAGRTPSSARSWSTARRNPSLPRRPSLARRHAVGRQRPSRADPRQQQGLQLHPAPSGWAAASGYSVNHGAGRQMSRGEAARSCRRARSMPTIGGWNPREPRWPRAHR